MKKLLLILFLLICQPAFATVQVHYSGPTAIGTAAATNYFYHFEHGAIGNNTTEGNRQSVAASAGTITKMKVLLSADPANGAGTQSVTVSTRIAGASSGPSCTISEGATTCESSTNGAYSAGNLLDVLQTAANTPAASNMEVWIWTVDGTDLETIYLASTGSTNLPTTGSLYMGITPGASSATENSEQIPMPFAGTVMGFYVALSGSPNNGGGTQTYTFTVEIGGSDSSSTCAISEAATTCNDTTNQPTFTKGQTITIEATVTAGTPTARTFKGGIVVANTVGGFAMVGLRDGNLPTSGTNYRPLTGVGTAWNATETAVDQISSPIILRAIYLDIGADPDNGAGTQSYDFTARNNATATGCACSVADGATTCNDTCYNPVFSDGQLAMEVVATNTPTATTSGWSLWADVSPPTTILNGTLLNATLN